MLIAMALSLIFTFTYATLAAKSKRAERLLVPLLDILQSVPILGFISITVVFFMALAPGRVLGAEFAAIFAIFTSQAWNMAFSFYQSLRTVPTELVEASRNFRLSPWMSFWRLDVPFAMPQLIWNMMMSMSGSWFFVVASEAISVGNTTITLPGVGSYIALAIEQRNLAAVGYAIVTMLIVILIYDQLLFRPLVAWADRFRFEQEPGDAAAAIVGARRAAPLPAGRPADAAVRFVVAALAGARWSERAEPVKRAAAEAARLDRVSVGWRSSSRLPRWRCGRSLRFVIAGHHARRHRHCAAARSGDIEPCRRADRARQRHLGADRRLGRHPAARRRSSSSRWRNSSPPFRPICCSRSSVSGIVAWQLNPNIWLSPLMILGTQWYILFNVVAGASAIPAELRPSAPISACAAGCGGGASRCPRCCRIT